ncbi:MAG: FAD:protein FMN transferase [Thermoguttaceae bacterium]
MAKGHTCMGGLERMVTATQSALVLGLVTLALVVTPTGATERDETPKNGDANALHARKQRFEFTGVEMAVPIKIVLFGADNATAADAAHAALARFHQLNSILSDYDAKSELRRLCDASSEGRAVRVSDDLWRVLVRAQQLSEQSAGAFDVTVGPIVHLWRNARRTKELPRPESIASARQRVGYRFVRLRDQHQAVELLRPNMRLDLGGIAKGYAVDEGMRELRRRGFTVAMIEAGGNLALGDPPPGKRGWTVGIAPPDVGRPPREYLSLSGGGVSTSGDLWQHATINGVRYSHLIDPRTGRPLTGRMSVTVVGRDGLSTDGLSSAAAVLGPEQGMKLIEDTPGAAGLMVQVVDGKETVHESSRWRNLAKADAR